MVRGCPARAYRSETSSIVKVYSLSSKGASGRGGAGVIAVDDNPASIGHLPVIPKVRGKGGVDLLFGEINAPAGFHFFSCYRRCIVQRDKSFRMTISANARIHALPRSLPCTSDHA